VVAVAGQFRLDATDGSGTVIGSYPDTFDSAAAAEELRDELAAWSANERFIVVEHLLLRPKFPGDGLYPVCSESVCATCGEEDPYSFRLTFVMPGWTAPFNTDMDMRGFAERTIRQEIPSHLAAKICWVGDDGYVEDLCDPVILELADLLIKEGQTSGGVSPAESDACACAGAIYQAFATVFSNWYQDKTLQHFAPDALKAALEAEFGSKVVPGSITCTTRLVPALWAEIVAAMVGYFQQVALSGWQFERFEAAWCAWLAANTFFDWTEERLQEQVQAILNDGLIAVTGAKQFTSDPVCSCAVQLLNAYGMQFYQWIGGMFASGSFDLGTPLPTFTIDLAASCPALVFGNDTDAKVRALLEDRYGAYREVSYRLWVVVNQLSQLNNTYPPATLYDCDQGSDKNPVRLGSTALGS